MQTVWILLAYLVSGYVMQYFITEERRLAWADRLNRFVLYVSLPALVFVYMSDLTFDRHLMLPVLSAWGLYGLSAALVLVLAYRYGWERSLVGALLMSIPYGNTSFLGIPFTQAFFGTAGVPYAIVYDQLGSFLILSTFGIATLSVYGAHQTTIPQALWRIVTFPAFLALLLALGIDGARVPAGIMDVLGCLAATLTPAALISIGLHVRLRLESGMFTPLVWGLAIKLIVAPLVLFGVFRLTNTTGLTAHVTLVEAGMGPMVSSTMLAIMARLRPRFVATLLGYGIVLSFLTVPMLYRVF
jgi:predicted permease